MYYRWKSNYQDWVVFVASPLSTQHYEERVKTGWSQDNVSESGAMSIDGLVLQSTSNKQYNLECWSSTQQASSSSSHCKLTLFLP